VVAVYAALETLGADLPRRTELIQSGRERGAQDQGARILSLLKTWVL